MSIFSIPLDIPGVEVINVEQDPHQFIITVKSTVSQTQCRKCGKVISKRHGEDKAILLRHLPIFDQPVYLKIHPVRYQCLDCKNDPTTTQKLPWYSPRSSSTIAYEEYILRQLINSTVTDVHHKERVGNGAIEGIVDRHVDIEVNWDSLTRLAILGIDEIALKKGHQDFVVIVSAKVDDHIHILAVLKDRKKATVKAFLQSIPPRLVETIESYCCDMYDGYINAAKEVFGNRVKIVIDRFHVAKHYRDGLDSLRKREMRRLKKALTEEEYQSLKGVMWALRKRPGQLKKEDHALLKRLFEYSPLLKEAYHYQHQLTKCFDANITPQVAARRLRRWVNRVQSSTLTCFDKFIKTLNKHWRIILTYFNDRITSGFVEGLNNKIKVIKRRCYGIFNTEKLYQRIFLDLEGYHLYA